MYKFFEHLYKRDQLEVILQQTGLMNPSKSVKFNKLKKFSKYLEQDENRIRLIEFLKKQLNNLNWNIRLKVNIVFHYILIANHHKSNYIKSFIQMYLSHDFLKSNLNSENKENMEQCIKINIIDQYSQYLIKYCISFDLYQICLKFKYMLSAEDIISTRVLTDAYRVINNINMIINQHENMNKMGRYYKKQKIMVDLYTMYLKNLGVYYEYLKRICQLILNNYQKFKKQSVAQYFLLFNEAEKSLGKVQDFFSIRYYRYDLRNITYPKYFIVDYIKYQQFAIYAKWLETSLKKEICNLEGIMDDSTRNIY